jgi:hypothetical protein
MAISFFLVVVVPLVAMLLHHQRKMAEFLHRGALQQNQQGQLDRLEAEMQDLKSRINQLILVHDDKRELQERVAPPRLPDQRT